MNIYAGYVAFGAHRKVPMNSLRRFYEALYPDGEHEHFNALTSGRILELVDLALRRWAILDRDHGGTSTMPSAVSPKTLCQRMGAPAWATMSSEEAARYEDALDALRPGFL